jgi:5-methylcytosine-specific restriction endonuclease McrA
MEYCVLLNQDYSFLNIINWKKAVCLVIKEKAKVLKYSERVIRHGDTGTEFKIPSVLILMRLIRRIYRNRVPLTKKNIMVRDDFKCVYCGDTFNLTIDHVVPVSRGGKTSFENCVTACRKCNNTKGDKLPRECGLSFSKQPHQPTISEFLYKRMKTLGVHDLLKDLGVY